MKNVIAVHSIKANKYYYGPVDEVALALFHLAHMLHAGVGLNDALREINALEPHRRMRTVWTSVASRIQSGQSLSQAMTEWPRVFDTVVVALIRAGEMNAQLAMAVDSARELLEWKQQAQTRLVTVLLYPVFALLVLTGVVVFLFIHVVPSMESFMVATQTVLAWHTRGLLALSDWLAHYYLLLLGVPLVTMAVMLSARCLWLEIRLRTDRYLLQLPVIGPLLAALSLSRYAHISGRLYRSGVELDHCLSISESLVSNLALRGALAKARYRLIAGASLGAALSTISDLPGAFRRLIAAGESAGVLGKALQQAGDQQQRQAQRLIERTERLIGPVMLILVGVNLLWIVVSVLGPVYDSAIEAVLQ